MSQHEGFLRNIRSSLGRSERLESPVSEPPTAVGPPEQIESRSEQVRELIARDADNLMDVVARVAEGAGWKVTRVAEVDAAGDYILSVARDIEARSVVYSKHSVVQAALGTNRFDGTGIDATQIALGDESGSAEDQRADFRSTMAASDLGVTGVDYAIAETGTCVIIPKAGVSRLVSLLPPVHIALVERGQVLPSLDELFTLRRKDFVDGNLGSYMNLITGPSRSADIEYTLVTGVHGPGEVHMVLIG